MLIPSNANERDFLAGVFADPEWSVEALSFRLFIGEEEFEAVSLSDSAADTGLPVMLEGSVAGELGWDWWGERVKIDAEVEGVKLPSYRGYLIYPGYGVNFDTITCSTAGYWAHGDESVKLGSKLGFTGRRPSDAAYEALSRIKWYPRINLPNVSTPPFTADNGDEFSGTAEVGEILDAVEAEADLRVYDRPTGEATGSTGTGLLNAPTEGEWEVGYHISDSGDDFTATLSDEGRFAAIKVISRTEGIDDFELLETIPIRYRHGRPPPGETYFFIEASDSDPESRADAREEGARFARELGNEWILDFKTVMLDPRVERGDKKIIRWRRPGTNVTRRFRASITNVSRDWIAKKGQYSARAVLLSEVDETDERIAVQTGLASRSVTSSVAALEGALYPSSTLYPSTTLYPSGG